jgi:hypothetical protein
VGDGNRCLALMHHGVFNVSCQPLGRVQSEAFRDCLRAEVGHANGTSLSFGRSAWPLAAHEGAMAM